MLITGELLEKRSPVAVGPSRPSLGLKFNPPEGSVHEAGRTVEGAETRIGRLTLKVEILFTGSDRLSTPASAAS